MISIELEQRFNKQQIFELYANEVYLGNAEVLAFADSPKPASLISEKICGNCLCQSAHILPESSARRITIRPPTATRNADCRLAIAC